MPDFAIDVRENVSLSQAELRPHMFKWPEELEGELINLKEERRQWELILWERGFIFRIRT